ncbi:MAG: FAD binding domain-containing protein [bacterium]
MPHSLDEALRIRRDTAAMPIAGGTDYMVQARARGHRAGGGAAVGAPPGGGEERRGLGAGGDILFLTRLPELRGVRVEGAGREGDGVGRIVIGAATTLTDLAGSPGCPEPLREIIQQFASPAIRNSATVGGNICNASPAADLLPFFYVHDATVVLQSAERSREMAIRDFITGPGETALRPDELLKEVSFSMAMAGAPAGSGKTRGEAPAATFYRKVAPRRSNALSKLSVYIAGGRTHDGRLSAFRAAIGGAAPTVVRLEETERWLCGMSVAEVRRAMPQVLEAYGAALAPIDDQRSSARYRRNTALRLLEHALTRVLERTTT